MKIKGIIFVLSFCLFFSAFTRSYAQWHPSSVLDCPKQKWTVSLGGQYTEMNWQKKNLKFFDREMKTLVGFSVTNWLKVAGNFGYSRFILRYKEMEEIRFDPDYHWGANLYVGPFPILPDMISISGIFYGEWFNPYSKKQISQGNGMVEWTESRENILEHVQGGVGLNLTFRTKTFDFFVGPSITAQEFHLKHLSTLERNAYSYELDRLSKVNKTGLVIGFMAGFGIRLPGQYYINLEIKNDNLSEFVGMVTLAQVGSPK